MKSLMIREKYEFAKLVHQRPPSGSNPFWIIHKQPKDDITKRALLANLIFGMEYYGEFTIYK